MKTSALSDARGWLITDNRSRGETWLRVLRLSAVLGSPEAMRLRDYSSFFRPDEFDALTTAYDAAWRDLWIKTLNLPADQVSALKSGADHSGFRLQWEA